MFRFPADSGAQAGATYVKRVALVALCLMIQSAAATNEIPWIGSVERAPVLTGEFEQIKTLKGFSRPLRSSGRFVAVRDVGILWLTKAPLQSSMRVTADEIVQSSGGKVIERRRTSDDPVARGVAQIMLRHEAPRLTKSSVEVVDPPEVLHLTRRVEHLRDDAASPGRRVQHRPALPAHAQAPPRTASVRR